MPAGPRWHAISLCQSVAFKLLGSIAPAAGETCAGARARTRVHHGRERERAKCACACSPRGAPRMDLPCSQNLLPLLLLSPLTEKDAFDVFDMFFSLIFLFPIRIFHLGINAVLEYSYLQNLIVLEVYDCIVIQACLA